MSIEKLMKERDGLDKHIDDGTGYLHIDFIQEGGSILSKVDAMLSEDMLEAALTLMIEKAAFEQGKGVVEFMTRLAVDIMIKNENNDKDED